MHHWLKGDGRRALSKKTTFWFPGFHRSMETDDVKVHKLLRSRRAGKTRLRFLEKISLLITSHVW